MIRTIALPIAALTAGAAAAQDLVYTLDPAQSVLSVDAGVTLRFAGDLRGDIDPVSNPGGTSTVPGLFGGGTANTRIPVSLGLGLDLDLGGPASGGFELSVDRPSASGTLRGLSLDLGRASSAATLEVVLEFSTFRTIAPNSLYVGGFPLPIPLGSIDIEGTRLEQTADADVLVLQPDPTLGATVNVSGLVPMDLTFDASLGGLLGGGGAPTPVGPIPVLLPFSFAVDLADCDAVASGGATQGLMQEFPSPVPLDLTDVPFDLPTILPPGQFAGVLFDLSADALAFEGSFNVAIEAASSASRFSEVCAGEPNSTGVGAVLEPVGSASLLAADFGLRVSDLPPNTFGMMIMSQVTDQVPGFGGSQGTLCLGEPCFRFADDVQFSGAAGEVVFFPDAGLLPQGQTFVAGDRWNFQYWYRDMNPGTTSNVSGAIGAFFCE